MLQNNPTQAERYTARYSLDRTEVDWIPQRFSCRRDISFSREGPLENFCSEGTDSEEKGRRFLGGIPLGERSLLGGKFLQGKEVSLLSLCEVSIYTNST